jgi:hypothetical protein
VNKTEIAKKAVSLVVGLGTTKIVNDIVENNTAPWWKNESEDAHSVTDKIAIKAGSVVIGSMAADATSSYTDRKIDEITAWWSKNVTARQPAN